MSINDVEDVIIPETPKVIDSEQIVIYVPKASYNTYGAARFQDKYFRVVDGTVSISGDFLDDITDAAAPYVGENGNWFVNGNDTGVKAEGQSGFDVPLRKGDYENTIIQRTTEAGLTNRTWYNSNIALGENAWSGFRGYYFDKIYIASDGKSGQLSICENEQPDKLTISSVPLDIFEGDLTITTDVEFTLICSDHFSLVGKVTAVDGNRISFVGHFQDFVERLERQANLGHGIYSNNTYTITNPEYDDYLFIPNSRGAIGYQFTSRAGLAIGRGTTCVGNFGFASGANTWVMDSYGASFGSSTYAGYAALSMGTNTRAKGKYTFAGNDGTQAIGKASFAANFYTKTYGKYSAAFNVETEATGEGSFAIGYRTKSTGKYSTAMNIECVAEGEGATAEGYRTKAKMKWSHTEGNATETNTNTIPLADSAHAEGRGSKATNYGAHAEGGYTTASGEYSHAQNYETVASGTRATAMGHMTKASGSRAVSEGENTEASGYCSHSAGLGTKATASCQFVIGRYNKINPDALLIVGNGTSAANTSNALEVLNDGDINGSSFLKFATGIAVSIATEEMIRGNNGTTLYGYYRTETLEIALDFTAFYLFSPAGELPWENGSHLINDKSSSGVIHDTIKNQTFQGYTREVGEKVEITNNYVKFIRKAFADTGSVGYYDKEYTFIAFGYSL